MSVCVVSSFPVCRKRDWSVRWPSRLPHPPAGRHLRGLQEHWGALQPSAGEPPTQWPLTLAGQLRHGAPGDLYRHVGDLGNILAGEDGVAVVSLEDTQLSLTGLASIVGRGVVVHAGMDDLGRVSRS